MIGSLCTGYGGLDLAVEQVTGLTTAWVCEHDKNASKILETRFPDASNLGDITAVDWATVPPVTVVTAGFPCQDVSHAGKRAGLRPGTRTGIWNHVAYAIGVLRPRLVILENVGGLLSADAHSDVEPCPWCVGDPADEHALRALGAVLADLTDHGYDAQWAVVRASDAGAPHQRTRVFIAAQPAPDTRRLRGDAGRSAAPRQTPGGRARGVAAGRDNTPPADTASVDEPRPEPAGNRGRRPEPSDRNSGDAAADPAGVGRGERRPQPTRRGRGPATLIGGTTGTAPADADGRRQGRRENSPSLGPVDSGDASQARQRQRTRTIPGDRSAADAPHADDGLWRGRDSIGGSTSEWPATGDSERPAATPPHADSDRLEGVGRVDTGRCDTDRRDRAHVAWGPYEPAIRRWETTLGRAAPPPTHPGRAGQPRLNPAFVEWLMGLPAGWVTDVPISRNNHLKALGNGVVPQQAVLALRMLGVGPVSVVGAA